jgi:hypothetical protein
MHAATSKDMVLTGDWVTPQVNGESFYDKPILYNWLAAIAFLILGFTESAARLPAALLGMGTVMVTYFLGRRMLGPRAGFLSGVILATSMEYIILSRVVVHDIALVFLITLALYFFYLAFKSETRRRSRMLAAYGAAGFAVLAKGPIGLLLPAMIIGIFLLLRRDLRFLKEMEIGWGLLVFCAVAAPWYVLISLRNQDYAGYFFIQQNLMNFLSGQARHPRPFYYYCYVFLGGFFPWSFFLPLALIRGLRGELKRVTDERLFLIVWAGVIFLFFSIARSKLPPYILPLFPAASLLVGGLWHDLLKAATREYRKGMLYSFIPLTGVFAVGLVALLVHPPTRLESKYGISLMLVYLLFFLMAGSVILAFLFFIKERLAASFAALAGMVAASILFFVLLIVPSINPYRSTKGLARKLDMMLPPEEKIVSYQELYDSVLFYTDRKAIILKTPRQLKEYLASEERVFCIIERKHFGPLEKLGQMTYLVAREGNKLLISNEESS